MFKLLHIQASPRGLKSYSVRVAGAFIEGFRQSHPQAGVETLALFDSDFPEFRAPEASAKYAVLSGRQPKDADAAAWKPVIEAINRFKSADGYLFSVPMWNFGVPYRLKQYIDVIVQPGLTFSYSPAEGYKGLVTGRPAMLVLSRGGTYPDESAKSLDFQESYMRTVLGFIGITDLRSIIVEGTLTPDAEKNLAESIKQAQAAGKKFP